MKRVPIALTHFFEHTDRIFQELAGKEAFLFLDYDGTLTPIVARPDLAVLSKGMRDILRRLSRLYTVSIVSGRATEDVKKKVRLNNVFYAGSHGFEIVYPNGRIVINREARKIRKVIKEVHQKVSSMLEGVDGALVEDVKYTISVHYRLVSAKDYPKVEKAVYRILNKYRMLKKTHGKKVFEIRPRIDWDKGKAVEWILRVLKFDQKRHLAFYIGDDVTDEDAFCALRKKGLGVLVAERPRPTQAKYFVHDTDDVKDLLEMFIKAKHKK